MADTWAFLRKGSFAPNPSGRDWRMIADHTPNALLDEVDRYGVETVWKAGMDALSYPFTWAHSNPEFNLIRNRLLEMFPNGD